MSIEERLEVIEARHQSSADWEGGLIIGAKHKQAIVTLVDRTTRYTLLAKVSFKTAEVVQQAICECFAPFKELFGSCTLDNRKESAQHELISNTLDGQVYFAQPYASHERGTNKNTNDLIRQYFLKQCDTTITDEALLEVQDKLNNKPRKVLDMQTPNELLYREHPNVELGY